MASNDVEDVAYAGSYARVADYESWFVEKNGAWFLPTFYEVEEEVRALDVKPGDVWIVTVPKSGTTWMQEMVWLLTHNLDYDGAKTLLKYRSPGLDGCWTKKYFKAPPVPFSEFERWASLSGGRRVLKTHLQYDFLPEKLRKPDSKAKIIFVARNPKDTVVSFYHFHVLYGSDFKEKVPLEDFCKSYMNGKYIAGPYWRQVKTFWRKRNDPNIMFVKYEDMKKDLGKVVREVAAFLEEPIPNEEQMKKLLDHLSFDKMKKNPAVNREGGEDRLRNDAISEDGKFIRKGIVGGWKEKLTPEMARNFDEWIKENTKDIDLKFEDSL